MRALVVLVVLLGTVRIAVSAPFTVFDLAWDDAKVAPRLRVSQHVAGRDFVGAFVTLDKAANILPCSVDVAEGFDRIVPTTDCPLFTQTSPVGFVVEGGAVKLTMAYDDGLPGGATANYDGSHITFASLPGLLAADIKFVVFFSGGSNRWEKVPVAGGVAQLSLAGTAGSVYVRGDTSAVYKVDWSRPAHADPSSAFLGEFAKHCSEKDLGSIADAAAFPRLDYVVCVNAANAAGWPRAVYNRQTVIRPNVTGAIIVRHWKEVVVAATTSGSAVSLTTAGFEGNKLAYDGGTPGPGVSMTQDQRTNAAYSLIVIPPHAPGAVHLDVKLVDPADATKVRAVYPVDLIVDQAYVGAFRIGVGYAFQVDDPAYSSHTAPGSEHPEIARSSANPFELVVGYSLYLDGFRNGRTYSLAYGSGFSYWWGQVKRHIGLYFGIGALAIDKSNVDFLKSLHVGLEIELGRNLSIAGTLAIRRTNTLTDDLRIGGPVPDSGISTKTSFDRGWGLILNLNTDFFRFAVNPGAK